MKSRLIYNSFNIRYLREKEYINNERELKPLIDIKINKNNDTQTTNTFDQYFAYGTTTNFTKLKSIGRTFSNLYKNYKIKADRLKEKHESTLRKINKMRSMKYLNEEKELKSIPDINTKSKKYSKNRNKKYMMDTKAFQQKKTNNNKKYNSCNYLLNNNINQNSSNVQK